MSERERYIRQKRSHQYRAKVVRLEKKLLVSAIIALFIITVLICASMKVQADSSVKNEVRVKYYTDVKVGNGDTLWNIATAHITEEYASVNDYISEIMEVNSLVDADALKFGQHLVVPYYS